MTNLHTKLHGDTITLTEGPVGRQIISFTLPLLLGNIFQQLYNTIDSVIVGNFSGSDALGAVGSSGPLINMLVSLFLGISAGAGVVVARHFGSKDIEQMRKAIHTTVFAGVIVSIFLTIAGVIVTPVLLKLMGTPNEIMDGSVRYFRIYFAGISGNIMYNIGSGIFRALGDSRRPLYFLIFSTGINIILDLLFVAVFNWGVAGAAVATIIAQFCSCILVFGRLFRDKGDYSLCIKEMRIDKKQLSDIIRMGLPAGIQNAIVSFSNVIVQTNINAFGKLAVAGCGAYSKIDGFALMPAGSFSLALTTFVSQNIGANKPERIKKGARFGIIAGMLISETAGVFIYIFAPYLIRLFDGDSEVIKFGVAQARNIVFAYFLVSFSHCMAGVLRGAGHAKVPMFTMVFFWCIVRIIWITLTVNKFNDIRFVFWAYPITWFLAALTLLLYYLFVKWMPEYPKKAPKTD